MAHDPQKLAELRAAYLSGLSLPSACEKAGIPFDTGKKWKQKAKSQRDDWDKIRSATLLSEGGLEDVLRSALAMAISQTQATLEMLKDADLEPLQKVQANAALGDALNKMGALIRRLMPETDELAIKLKVLKEFAEFVRNRYPKAASLLVEALEDFGAQLVKA